MTQIFTQVSLISIIRRGGFFNHLHDKDQLLSLFKKKLQMMNIFFSAELVNRYLFLKGYLYSKVTRVN